VPAPTLSSLSFRLKARVYDLAEEKTSGLDAVVPPPCASTLSFGGIEMADGDLFDVLATAL